MKHNLKIIGLVAAALFVIAGLWTVNNFVYPFKSVSPNYADVERAFGRLQFPADWKEISSSENKGLHGRGCDPLNNAGCFHKSKTFMLPSTASAGDLKNVIIQSGLCTGLVENDITQLGEDKPSVNLNCGAGGGVNIGVDYIGIKSEAYVSVKTY